MFLALAVTEGNRTEKHDRFLEEFWKEDYEDAGNPVVSRIPRAFSRKGIRPFVNRALAQEDPSTADAVSRTVFEMYSGFLHGAAPHITELYDEHAERFLVDGIATNERYIDYILDAQNSLYRSLLSVAVVSKAFGLKGELELAQSVIAQFVRDLGPEWILKAD